MSDTRSPKPTDFVLSDLHLGHENILGLCRPWFKSIQEHDDYIIQTINNTCEKGEFLWLLGDIAWNKEGLRRLAEINAQMYLIGGNHDNYSTKTYLQYFQQVRGVAEMRTDEGKVLFTHIPMHQDQTRWYKNIHGHLHTYHTDDDRYINVSCEPMNFTPKRIADVLNLDS